MVIINVCYDPMMQMITHTTEAAIAFICLIHSQLALDRITTLILPNDLLLKAITLDFSVMNGRAKK